MSPLSPTVTPRARRPPPRRLARRPQNPPAHLGQSLPLAEGKNRNLPPPAARRAADLPAGSVHHKETSPPRPRASHPGNDRQARTGSPDLGAALPRTRLGRGHGRPAVDRSLLEISDHATLAHHHAGRRVGGRGG